MSTPRFSIVISTFNRAGMLQAALDSIRQQHAHVPYEVIVVDNNSSDDTHHLVRSMQSTYPVELRYVLEKRPGVAAARNAGIDASRGTHIAFIDDDVVVHAGWIDALAGAHRIHPDTWCVGGRIALTLPQTLPPWFEPGSQTLRAYLSEFDRGEGTERLNHPDGILGGNFSVNRLAFQTVGMFDRRLGHSGRDLMGGEETDLCWRIQAAGKAVYYCGAASVAHVVPQARLSKRFLRARAFWEGRTKALLSASPSWRSLLNGCARTAFSYGLGRFDAGFEHELELWKLGGYLRQKALAPRSNGRARYMYAKHADDGAPICAESAGS